MYAEMLPLFPFRSPSFQFRHERHPIHGISYGLAHCSLPFLLTKLETNSQIPFPFVHLASCPAHTSRIIITTVTYLRSHKFSFSNYSLTVSHRHTSHAFLCRCALASINTCIGCVVCVCVYEFGLWVIDGIQRSETNTL